MVHLSLCQNQKKNTIDREKIINNYGADSARLFILSDSPPEKDVQWSDEGIISSFKFIQKLWVLNSKFSQEINKNHKQDSSQKIKKFTNRFIKKMTDSLNSFSYNILIANLHEMYAFLNKEIENQYTKKTLEENFSKILTVMMPIIPHFVLECMQLNNFDTQQKWPAFDENLLVEDKIKFVIQINGKKRAIIDSEKDTDEKKLLELVKKDNLLVKYIMNKDFKKIIFVKNKLINILI